MTSNQLNRFSDILNTKFLMLSKPLVKLIGLQPAITFCELMAEYKYWKEHDQLTNDDFFFSTEPNLSENTGLSPSQLRSSFKILKDKNFIFIQRRGTPSKNYFRINPDILSKLETDLEITTTERQSSKPTDGTIGRFTF